MATNKFNFGTGGTPIPLAAATTLTESANGNRTHLLNLAGGFTVTLPTSTGNGANYKFLVQTVSTTGYIIKVANTTDIVQGTSFVFSDNAANAVIGFATTGTSDTITLNGTTTGGVSVGDWVELQDFAAGVYSVRAFVQATGTEATPFSATV